MRFTVRKGGVGIWNPRLRLVLWAIFHPRELLWLLDETAVDRDVWKGRAMEAVQCLAVARYPASRLIRETMSRRGFDVVEVKDE